MRPLNDKEKEVGAPAPPLRYEKNLIVDPEAERTWKFDFVWTQESRNEDIYANVASAIVAGVVEGYNGTVFAYGQTSSVCMLYEIWGLKNTCVLATAITARAE